MCVEDAGDLSCAADGTKSSPRSGTVDVWSLGVDGMLSMAKEILAGDGGAGYDKVKKLQQNSPGERGKLSGCHVLPGRSISGLNMEAKGTFAIEVKRGGESEKFSSVHDNMAC